MSSHVEISGGVSCSTGRRRISSLMHVSAFLGGGGKSAARVEVEEVPEVSKEDGENLEQK